eukprot:1191765-Prorocentrum_minimum.AAC.1
MRTQSFPVRATPWRPCAASNTQVCLANIRESARVRLETEPADTDDEKNSCSLLSCSPSRRVGCALLMFWYPRCPLRPLCARKNRGTIELPSGTLPLCRRNGQFSSPALSSQW